MKNIEFSGYTWQVKSSDTLVGPGPNYFSDSEDAVYIDQDGLHLGIKEIDSVWYSTEVMIEKPLGFGTYTVCVTAPLVNLEFNAVFALFLYENDTQELDIEFSGSMVGKNKGQFVNQPGITLGNVKKFRLSQDTQTSHSIFWTEEYVEFRSWNGHGDQTFANSLYTWKYKKKNITSPNTARFILNLWLYKGIAPSKNEEVIINSFEFIQKIN